MHNYYTYLYNEAVFEVLEKKKGKDEAVLFARSATAGGQKFPVHWGGDCWSDYESMEESLRGGLSLQLSGFGFWSHDIGGFETLLPRMSIRDGVRLVCFLLTAVCMEVHHTVCRGLMTMRPWMCCAALYA